MRQGHSNHFVLFNEGLIYVLAGCNENNRFTNKCERFSLETNTWESIASLNETRDSISGTLDRRKNCLFIAGGRIDNGVLSNGIEKYDIEKNYWKELSIRLPYSVDMHGLVLLPSAGTKLLLFAGLDTNQQSTNRC
jgi:N-acetylneuraminic acid mutarotase